MKTTELLTAAAICEHVARALTYYVEQLNNADADSLILRKGKGRRKKKE